MKVSNVGSLGSMGSDSIVRLVLGTESRVYLEAYKFIRNGTKISSV